MSPLRLTTPAQIDYTLRRQVIDNCQGYRVHPSKKANLRQLERRTRQAVWRARRRGGAKLRVFSCELKMGEKTAGLPKGRPVFLFPMDK